jgi:hypothetical protein
MEMKRIEIIKKAVFSMLKEIVTIKELQKKTSIAIELLSTKRNTKSGSVSSREMTSNKRRTFLASSLNFLMKI